jgi:hypothetical protein
MKKAIAILLLFACLMSFSSCGSRSVKIVDHSSEIYSDEDIEAAMKVVMQTFDESSELWYLLELSYIGDDRMEDYQDYTEREEADEVIVLLSDFYISIFSTSPVMNIGSKYEGFGWILVRNEGEDWRIVDRGY